MAGYRYILTTKHLLNPAVRNAVKPMIKDLHNEAKHFPGFIYAKSFWNNDKTKLFTITKWNSIDHWNNWEVSPIRNSLLLKHYHTAMRIEQDYIDKFDHPEFDEN